MRLPEFTTRNLALYGASAISAVLVVAVLSPATPGEVVRTVGLAPLFAGAMYLAAAVDDTPRWRRIVRLSSRPFAIVTGALGVFGSVAGLVSSGAEGTADFVSMTFGTSLGCAAYHRAHPPRQTDRSAH